MLREINVTRHKKNQTGKGASLLQNMEGSLTTTILPHLLD